MAHEAEATRAIDEEAAVLDEVWEMALDEYGGSAVPLTDLSELLLGDSTSPCCYATYCLLESDQGRTLFKSVKEGSEFAPRSVTEKEALGVRQCDSSPRHPPVRPFRLPLTHGCGSTSSASDGVCQHA